MEEQSQKQENRTAIDFGVLSDLKVTAVFNEKSHKVEPQFNFKLSEQSSEKLSELMKLYEQGVPLNVIIYTPQSVMVLGDQK